MPPETPGRAAPRDPSSPEGTTGAAPRFGAGAEQVDEATSRKARAQRRDPAPSSSAPSVPTADRPRRPGRGPGSGPVTEAASERRRDRGPRRSLRAGKVRARKVQRVVRHIEPWSVLKISVLFFLAIYLIICVASALLWSAARASGSIDDVESFITSVGGFGNCEAVDGAADDTTPTTQPGPTTTGLVDQIDPAGDATTVPAPVEPTVDDPVDDPVDDEDCPDGQVLVGEFRFEDGRIFQAFALGGIVLVLAGAATAVVLVLLFNLLSDLTGGVRVTVLEEDPAPRTPAGSPGPRPRD